MEFLNRIVKLRISLQDLDVKLLLQICDQGIKDGAKDTKIKQEHNVSDSNIEVIEKESDHDKTSEELDCKENGND